MKKAKAFWNNKDVVIPFSDILYVKSYKNHYTYEDIKKKKCLSPIRVYFEKSVIVKDTLQFLQNWKQYMEEEVKQDEDSKQ